MPNDIAHLFPALQAALAGQYAFERDLGSGGMATVILARDVRLDRRVAIKVLPTTQGEDPKLHVRFLREARIAGQLSHPNIIPVFRADELGGHAFFAMPYIEGDNLGDVLQRERTLSPIATARILREVAWALAYAHARGVVHRDIKPENIMMEHGSGRAIVTDFGIAHSMQVGIATRGVRSHVRDDMSGVSDATSEATREATSDATSPTGNGQLIGTVQYMSPEQIHGEALDGRSDLYSLGVVGFLALTGRLPFVGTLPAVLVGHVNACAPKVGALAPHAPEYLAAVIDRCLAKRPEDRFECGETLADALEKAARLAEHAAPPERRHRAISRARRWLGNWSSV
ncbi:MAG: serine/threonine-protein kinase [Gemmatimonadaceae bacterium]